MSIVTLKRKTQAQYNNVSVGQKAFSLNGTHRSQGYVGQTMLSRSLPRTLMKGNAIRGHGGCCGKYPIYPIVSSAVTSLNNPNVVKPSCINTMGMIETKYYENILHHCPVVKPDNNNNTNTQQQFINNLVKCTIKTVDSKKANDAAINAAACKACKNYNPYFRKTLRNYTESQSKIGPISQGERLLSIDKKCSNLDKVIIASKLYKSPLPGPSVSH
jgi:hypothetical protein